MSLKVFSDAFENGRIQEKYGKMSSDSIQGVPQLSFPIRWEDAPDGTKSFALVFTSFGTAIKTLANVTDTKTVATPCNCFMSVEIDFLKF